MDTVPFTLTKENMYMTGLIPEGASPEDTLKGAVTIPETFEHEGAAYRLIRIGAWAFFGCNGMESVTVPDSVTGIGDSAFSSCKFLYSVSLPDSVEEIGNFAFENCKCLASIRIPESATFIGDYAFFNCKSLASLKIPDSVREVGDNAFLGCSMPEMQEEDVER